MEKRKFALHTEMTPRGDQPGAISGLTRGVNNGLAHQVMLGVTGSGKTFTMANVVAEVQKPTLVIAPNKTLAAQLYNEFKSFFPENAVEYFVSYYDYYQPEAYLPVSDTYIQKDSSINEMIDKMRHSATRSVLSRKDVLVVASVSCIFGLGAPEDYLAMRLDLETDMELTRDKLLADLVEMQYQRNDMDFYRGVFRVRGDRVEIFPAYEEDRAIRVEFFGDVIEAISEIDPLTGKVKGRVNGTTIYPASHYVTQERGRRRIIDDIQEELKHRIDHFRDTGKLIEAQRIEERTRYDMEMILELGYCNGIENYARHITGRAPGQPPPTLLDYFPDDFLLFIDESHISVPQIRGMYNGDRSRKQTLVEYGFRLPSALDNRPLRFEEFSRRVSQVIYVSATPSDYELEKSGEAVMEQIVRPTGLIDPEMEVRSAKNQVDDLYSEIQQRIRANQRVLVTTLTKRMAEDLTEYYTDLGVRVRYLHSDIKTLERIEIIRDLRAGEFDVLVGINLLREGLDIPEVSLVAILDADKEGFLRSARSLIQTFGRAARNASGTVIMYAETVTPAMRHAMEETGRRRRIQKDYNQEHNIIPATIEKSLASAFGSPYEKTGSQAPEQQVAETAATYGSDQKVERRIRELEAKMRKAADNLEFEKAARYRDRVKTLKKMMVFDFEAAV
ncbi:excinuclease ABC subunit B [Desulfosalsimonas propionicica]|uniref:UvrABC system protein B n=1 Tax=Desulfosalsimonas propionicica TaxID=332175 RepID=A0A7W0HK51_9BACT|nr:excinuclease ABC subunit UvrB [Desulfosalsimonas propionicica]MBA2880716.1 excinuclease ABC subunit B [Desulfosalsimonas propionicica]